MTEGKFWSNQRFGRRTALRGAALGGVGIAGAALIGCGSDDDDAATATASATASGTAAGTATATATEMAGPNKGGVLKFGHYRDDGASLSMLGGGGHDRMTHWHVHGDGYTWITGSSEIVPMLWESFEWVEPTKLSIKLQPGVKFQDGTDLNGEAVAAHMDAIKDAEKSPRFTTYRSLLSPLADWEVVSDTELVFNTDGPDLGFTGSFGLAVGIPWSLAWSDKLGDDELARPRMTGPYVADDYVSGASWQATKFDDYWNAANGEPHLDAIDFRILASNETRAAALEAREIDSMSWVTADPTMSRLESLDQVTMVYYDRSPQMVGLNPYVPPLDDLRVRQALSHATDREKVLQNIYGGLGEVMGGICLEALGGKFSDPYPYDVAKAKALLAEAGYTDANRPKLLYALEGSPPSNQAQQQAALMKEMYDSVGFDIEIVNLAQGETAVRVSGKNADMHIFATNVGQRLDPYGSYALRLLSDGGLNPGRFHTDDERQIWMDTKIREGRAMIDPVARQAASDEISDYYHENVMGLIPICRVFGAIASNDNVGGMDHPDIANPIGASRPRYLYLKA